MSNWNLFHCCRENETEEILGILETESDIDIFYEEGSFFFWPVKNDNIKVVIALLDFFEHKFSDSGSYEYQRQKNNLNEVLQEVNQTYNI